MKLITRKEGEEYFTYVDDNELFKFLVKSVFKINFIEMFFKNNFELKYAQFRIVELFIIAFFLIYLLK